MRKLLLLILFASYSFAVNDTLYKPVKPIDENVTKTLYSTVLGYPEFCRLQYLHCNKS